MDSRLKFLRHRCAAKTDGGTRKARPSGLTDVSGDACRPGRREIRDPSAFGGKAKRCREVRLRTNQLAQAMPPRKASKEHEVTVSQSDTGRRGENPKALEITLDRELGKLAPYLRKKGCPHYVMGPFGDSWSGRGSQ